ncbi:MAG: sensor histidine kinase, partial [Gammaproteobacteria bacterium]
QIRQLFQNLVANGLKFQAEGARPELRIRCELETDEDGEDFARISFEDNGIGFEERYLDRIFDPFQQLHGRNKFAGSGIGLAICRRVVERHGGSITAESTPGAGSTFIIRLPLMLDVSISESQSL